MELENLGKEKSCLKFFCKSLIKSFPKFYSRHPFQS